MTPEAANTPLVYFISGNEWEHPIKIGKTTGARLVSRLKTIQTGLPTRLFILHLEEAPPEFERKMHRDFSCHRVRGEWFEWAPPLVDFIERLEIASGPGWRQKFDAEGMAFRRSIFGHSRGYVRRNINPMFGLGKSAA